MTENLIKKLGPKLIPRVCYTQCIDQRKLHYDKDKIGKKQKVVWLQKFLKSSQQDTLHGGTPKQSNKGILI